MKDNGLRSQQRRVLTGILAGSLLMAAAPAPARVMLQYFESRWQTIERRMPDVFLAGYGALWLPPAARADSSNFSVGFDVFDRFDLGKEGNETLYGTEAGLVRLVAEARRAGIYTYFDTVYNHNGFSNGYRGDQTGQTCALNWAIGEGGYPGFVMSGRDLSLPFDLEFRNICPSAEFPDPNCDTDPLNCRISGLIDINHDTNYRWIRHPAVAGNVANIPYQQARPENARLYPDQALASPYDDGVKPFNLADPLAGDPGEENVNQMLQRYTQWMLEVNGVAGFRLDAVKHTPAGWFTNVYDFAAHNRARDFWGRQMTPFSFGEFVSSDNGQLAAYHRKDGYGNRTVLDFPLKFAMQGNIANPSGNFGAIIGTTFDNQDDGDSQNGSAGMMFVSSHDTGYIGDPAPMDNVAYAHILSRKGFPLVYFNAQEFGDGRDFPNRTNRGDALGDFGSSTITKLVKINNQHVNGIGGNGFRSLWQDADYVAYELNNTLVVGMTDRTDNNGGLGYVENLCTNFGFRNVRLKEVTGTATDATVDPTDDIRDFIDIPDDGRVLFRVPTGSNKNGDYHGRPYVMYTIEPPQGTFTVANSVGTLPIDNNPNEKLNRHAVIPVVTANTAQIRLQINGGSPEDNALIRWNHGINIDGDNNGDFGIAAGVDSAIVGGFDNFTSRSPTVGGGTGAYAINVDLTNPAIGEGFQYITSVAFIQRLSGLPPIFNQFRQVIYVDRVPPGTQLIFPQNPDGTDDIDAGTYGFVVDNPDGTANSMHYFWNVPPGTDPNTLTLTGENKANKTDRKRFRFNINNLTPGPNQKLTLLTFEESGNRSVTEYTIGISGTVADSGTSMSIY